MPYLKPNHYLKEKIEFQIIFYTHYDENSNLNNAYEKVDASKISAFGTYTSDDEDNDDQKSSYDLATGISKLRIRNLNDENTNNQDGVVENIFANLFNQTAHNVLSVANIFGKDLNFFDYNDTETANINNLELRDNIFFNQKVLNSWQINIRLIKLKYLLGIKENTLFYCTIKIDEQEFQTTIKSINCLTFDEVYFINNNVYIYFNYVFYIVVVFRYLHIVLIILDQMRYLIS